MPEYQRPGVYVEERSVLGNSVVPVQTAVPAFVGYTQKAQGRNHDDLTLQPTRISTLLEYNQLFGGPNVKLSVQLGDLGSFTASDVTVGALTHHLYYSLQLYFANGGGPLWVVSVGGYPGSGQAQVEKGKLLAGLEALDRISEVTLVYFPDIGNMAPKTIPSTAAGNRFEVLQRALEVCGQRMDRFLVMDLADPVEEFREKIGSHYLSFGAVYAPDLQTSLPWQQTDAQISLVRKSNTQDEGVVALDGKTLEEALALAGNDAKVGKIVVPQWVARVRAAVSALPLPVLPPGGAVLGSYVAVDAQQGVWKAPANVALKGVNAPVTTITDAAQIQLNTPLDGKAINAIRQFEGQGTVIWGARTLDGNSHDWRYIQVRRTVLYIEQSIKAALQWVVFEPNTTTTWIQVKSMVESFLSNVWRQGGLAGATAEEAYIVQSGLGQSMTAEDVLNGRLVVNVALAVTRPAEYILLTLTQSMGS